MDPLMEYFVKKENEEFFNHLDQIYSEQVN
nr:MAG TPA: hypothetical protein [Caudoviricetes sp.]DAY40305.1 MAG TPA: hypothetical protein [Caudoviricetes sp.]